MPHFVTVGRAAAVGAAGLLAFAVATGAAAADPPTGSDANHPQSWETYLADQGHVDVSCVKRERGFSGDSWTSDGDYLLVVLKSALNNFQFHNEFRGVSEGQQLTTPSGQDIGHITTCLGSPGTTPTPTVVPPVDVTPTPTPTVDVPPVDVTPTPTPTPTPTVDVPPVDVTPTPTPTVDVPPVPVTPTPTPTVDVPPVDVTPTPTPTAVVPPVDTPVSTPTPTVVVPPVNSTTTPTVVTPPAATSPSTTSQASGPMVETDIPEAGGAWDQGVLGGLIALAGLALAAAGFRIERRH